MAEQTFSYTFTYQMQGASWGIMSYFSVSSLKGGQAEGQGLFPFLR